MVDKAKLLDIVLEAHEDGTADDGAGVCHECLEFPDYYCEPDVEKGKCQSCGALAVYGMAQSLMMCA